MSGHGTSYGAVSVMNAIPCGIGSTIGIGLRTDAEFTPSDSVRIELVDRPNLNPRLAEVCARRALEWIGEETEGFELTVRTDIPPSQGLKSSSSVCNAVISAVLDSYGVDKDPLEVVRLGVECAKYCKVTITGAFDDACGCHLGGLVVTDNRTNELILRKEIPRCDVVVCLPDRSITKDKVPVEKYRQLSDRFEKMVPMIEHDYLDVMIRNGEAVDTMIGQPNPLSKKALKLGALAAGTSGTGPATAILAGRGEGKEIAEQLGCRYILTETR